MQDRSFGSGGALFVRDKKSAKAPDYGGDFTLEGDVLEYVLANAKSGKVKLEMSGWKRMGRNNTVFISTQVQTPYEARGGQSRQPQGGRGSYGGGGQRQQGGYSGRSMEDRPRQEYQREEPRRDMRQELNDDIPDFGSRGGRRDNSPPWE